MSFNEYYLSKFRVKLKQFVGRLKRTTDNRGCGMSREVKIDPDTLTVFGIINISTQATQFDVSNRTIREYLLISFKHFFPPKKLIDQ